MKWKYRWRAFTRMHGQARSVLAGACLALGIAVLLQVLAFETSARAQIDAILADAGSRMLTIVPGESPALPGRARGPAVAETLTCTDYRLLNTATLPATRIAALSTGQRRLEFRELAVTATVTGTQPEYFAIRRYEPVSGRLLEEADDVAAARVAVLGARTAHDLFGAGQEGVLAAEAAIGSTILIGRMPFEVVGILAPRGSGQTGISQDDGVYVPLGTALRRVFNVHFLNSIVVEAESADSLVPLRTRVDTLLRDSHGLGADDEADFKLLDANLARAAVERNRGFANLFFRGLALMILGMAGAGIFAVNHLNVTERTAEFGLRRAVGARRRDIAGLVLAETLLLGVAAGAAGVVLGLALLYVLRALTAWQLAFAPQIPLQALGAAVILSMLAALIPAARAAARQPLAALNRL